MSKDSDFDGEWKEKVETKLSKYICNGGEMHAQESVCEVHAQESVSLVIPWGTGTHMIWIIVNSKSSSPALPALLQEL